MICAVNLLQKFFCAGNAVIDISQLSMWVNHKGSGNAHHAPAAGNFRFFRRINLNHAQGIAKFLAQRLYGWTLYRFAWHASWRGEIDQSKCTGANRLKVSNQAAGAELKRPVVEKINAEAAENDREGDDCTG